MKRTDISEIFPEATDEQIKKLMDINGADINSAKKGMTDLQAQLTAAQDEMKRIQSEAPSEDTQKQLKALQKELDGMKQAETMRLMREKGAVVELDSKLTSRAVNEGFSGGEKKKNEIFQMAMLEPTLSILDETDSGLDIDALRIVATGVTRLKREDNATVVITHYQRLLDYIVPDYVHVLYKGRIIYSGDKSLALKLEKEGYDWLINDYKE